jgi:hypothetical protein
VFIDDKIARSGVHWNWANRQKPGHKAFAQPLLSRATNNVLSERLWQLSKNMVGL